jgi:hypothetical protein
MSPGETSRIELFKETVTDVCFVDTIESGEAS